MSCRRLTEVLPRNPARVAPLVLLTLIGPAAAFAAERSGRVYFENRTPDSITLRIESYVDQRGTVQRPEGKSWKFDPNGKGRLLINGKPFYASKVEYAVTSPLGERRWVSKPRYFDKDGDLPIYHARRSKDFVYQNPERFPVKLRISSYVDIAGRTQRGPWTYTFAANERAKPNVAGKPISASRVDYTVIAGTRQATHSQQYTDRWGFAPFVASGGPGGAGYLAAKPVPSHGVSDEVKQRVIVKLLAAWGVDALVEDPALRDEEHQVAGFFVGLFARATKLAIIKSAVEDMTPGQSPHVRLALEKVIEQMFDGDLSVKSFQREMLEAELMREVRKHNAEAAGYAEGIDFLADLWEARERARK